MARRHANTTKYEIVQTALKLFLERGYNATTPKTVCDELDISTGNLTYYFPTKESLLQVLAELLCKFQGKALQTLVQEEGTTSLLAVCLEMAIVATISEEDVLPKDVFQAIYLSPLCLDYIRKNDTQRAKYIFAQYCPDWTEQQYIEAEILVSGIEYAMLTSNHELLPLEDRLVGALNNMMMIYNVPKNVREQKIQKVLAMDYRQTARDTLLKFKRFVVESNSRLLENLIHKEK